MKELTSSELAEKTKTPGQTLRQLSKEQLFIGFDLGYSLADYYKKEIQLFVTVPKDSKMIELGLQDPFSSPYFSLPLGSKKAREGCK